MKRWLWAAVLLFLIAALFSMVLAQSSQFEIPWHSVDSGGGTSSGSDFALRAVIGQPETGSLSGGDYAMGGGFLALPVPGRGGLTTVFVPLVMKPG
jgi:hypothetical protein